jgi:hypothetical protein
VTKLETSDKMKRNTLIMETKQIRMTNVVEFRWTNRQKTVVEMVWKPYRREKTYKFFFHQVIRERNGIQKQRETQQPSIYTI